MNYPLNPATIHRELGPGPLGERTASGGVTAGGAIVFNDPATQPTGETNTLQKAIAGGDTLQKRLEAFLGCFPGQK